MLKIPKKVNIVIQTLIKNGYEAYIVGGCVRDMLMGNTPEDYDVTTSATPDIVISLFKKTAPTGIKHGTVTVIVDSVAVEVTTFRTEGDYADNRHPEKIEFVSSLSMDLSRRDFTVNAMAFNENEGLVDLFGGQNDINGKILRTVGSPEKRFSEDALRILRLFRFASVLGFCIEEETQKFSIEMADSLKNISKERIAVELKKAVTGKNFKVFKSFIENGGFSFLNILNQPKFEVIEKCSENKEFSLFAFLYTSGSDVLAVADDLKLSNKEKSYFEKMLVLLNHSFPKTKEQVKERLCLSSLEIFKDYLLFSKACGVNINKTKLNLEEILAKREPYLISHLCIGGKEIKKLGYKGEEIGSVLEILRKAVVQNPENNNLISLENILKKL